MATLFIARFDRSLKWCTFSTICWFHVKLLSSRRTFRVHHTTIHQFTVSFYLKPVSDFSLYSTKRCFRFVSAQYRTLFQFFFFFFLCTVQNSVLDVLISLCVIPNIVSDMIVSLLLYNTKLCFRRANFHLCSVKYHFRHANLSLSETKPCFRYTDFALC